MTKNRMLPEWAPVQAIMMAWPYPHGDWHSNYDQVLDCYWSLLGALATHVDVWLMVHPSLDCDGLIVEIARRQLNRERIEITVMTYDDTWMRDYGPISTASGCLSFTFNGWGGKFPADQDNQLAPSLFQTKALAITPVDFVCEGGALETNGLVLLMNANCVVDDNRNPGFSQSDIEKVLVQNLGVTECVWLEGICLTGDDTDGHIDTIARFASLDTLLYSGPNEHHVDAACLQSLHDQVQKHAARLGWRTIALPSPEYRSLVDQRLLPCTYANFLIVNDVVFAPVYGLDEDQQALTQLRNAFPEAIIVPVRCDALLEQHGSLHCATMQVAVQSLSVSDRLEGKK